MKNIYSITAILFLVLLSVNFASAGTQIIPDYGYSFEIKDFQVNPDLTITDVIKLCVQESCIIDEGEENNPLSNYSHKWKTVTIRSHYDNEVALILKYDSTTNAEGTQTTDGLRLTTILPYEPNQACLDYAFEPSKGCEIISTHINPEDYDAVESVNTDLKFLRELNVMDLSNEEIDEMSSLAKVGKSIHKLNDKWVQVGMPCVPVDIAEEVERMGYDSFEEYKEHIHHEQESLDKGWYESCPVWGNSPQQVSTIILPEKAYGVQENVVTPNQEDESASPSNLIYWIVGIALVLVIVLFLVFRRKH